VQHHRDGWKYVMLTDGTRSSLRIFLAALKLFYQVMCQHGDYAYQNPLIDSMSATIAAAVLAARRQDVRTVEFAVRSLHRLFPALGLQTVEDWHADTHLPRYLKSEVVPTDSQYTRFQFLLRLQMAEVTASDPLHTFFSIALNI